MGKLGCLFIIIAVAAMIGIIVIPVLPPFADNAQIDGMLTPLLCLEDETIERDQYSGPSREGGTSYSMDVYCVDKDGERRDETGRWALIGGAGFTLPFLVGLAMVIAGGNSATRKRVNTNIAGYPSGTTSYPSGTKVDLDNFNTPFGSGGAGGSSSGSTFSGSNPSASFGTGMSSSSGGKSLSERLTELQEARDAGLVTADEYDRLRKEILDSSR